MKSLSLEQTADYLDTAIIDQSIDEGHAITHIGKNKVGCNFIIVNNCMGETMLSESIA